MSHTELLTEIERLRTVLSILASYGVGVGELLGLSQQLDELIVKYQKAVV